MKELFECDGCGNEFPASFIVAFYEEQYCRDCYDDVEDVLEDAYDDCDCE